MLMALVQNLSSEALGEEMPIPEAWVEALEVVSVLA